MEITIDASLLLKAYKQGLEDAFIILKDDFPELDEELRINDIDNDDTD